MILNFIKTNTWGGCAVLSCTHPRYSIVGHGHRDHIVADSDITIVGPVDARDVPELRNRNYIHVSNYIKINKKITIQVIDKRTLRSLGLKPMHTNPILVIAKISRNNYECALYIDDFDMQDVPEIKKLIDIVKAQFHLTAILLPVYNGCKGHGAKNPKDLQNASRELISYALNKAEYVFGLAHPVIPNWFKSLQEIVGERLIPMPKKFKTLA